MNFSKILKILPILLALITLIMTAGLLYSVNYERDIYLSKEKIIKLGNEFKSVSDFLTEQARYYVQYGEKEYYDAYLNETNELKTREKIQNELIELGAPQTEIDLLSQAAILSYELELFELQAFAEAINGNLEKSRAMLFSEKYVNMKQPINNTINVYLKTIEIRCNEETYWAKIRLNITLTVFIVILAIDILIIYYISNILKKRIQGMNRMIEQAVDIADGNFNFEFEEYTSNDEFGKLADSLEGIFNIINIIYREINRFTDNAAFANLNYSITAENLKGDWKNIVDGLENVITTVRTKIIESAPIAYVVVVDNHVTDCNLYAEKKLGIVRGTHMSNYYKDTSQRRSIIKKINAGNTVEYERVTLRTGYGEYRRYAVHISMIDDAEKSTYVIWGLDIESDEEKTDMLRRNQADLKMIIDSLPIAVVIEEEDTGNIEYANAACTRMLEYNLDFENHKLIDAIKYSDIQSDKVAVNEKYNNFMNALKTKPIVQEEFTIRTATGRDIDTRVTACEIIYHNNKCIMKVIQDISDEILRNQMLERAEQREREANQLKKGFVANISHEIRTPMNGIIGLSEIALARNPNAEYSDIFRRINSSSKNLMNIINDIMDFSVIEAENLQFNDEEFNLGEIISGAFLGITEFIGNKHIEMLADISMELPVKVIGDKNRLRQIIKNLLENSAKYTENGNILLEVYTDKKENDAISIAFQVTDTGIGMNEDHLNMIFTPFKQFNEVYKYKNTGTGLGLSIVKKLLDLLGGTIEIESEEGIGTCVTVKINYKLTSDKSTLGEQILSEDNKNISVLIADDDIFSCEIMKKTLETAGFKVAASYNKAGIIEKIKNHQKNEKTFDLIIINYLLGSESADNGIEISREVSNLCNIPMILMLSSSCGNVLDKEVCEVGFADIIQKPIMPTDFVRRILDSLDKKSLLENNNYVYENVNILLCEDNKLNQEVSVEMLKLMNINTDIAVNGKECLEMLLEKEYDLVLMDIMMPVMDGIVTTQEIRNSAMPFKNVTIVALTAAVSTEQVREILDVGMNDYIAKPLEFVQLYDIMRKYLPLHKQVCVGKQINVLDLEDNEMSDFIISGVNTKDGISRFMGKSERYYKSLLRFATEYEIPQKTETTEEFKRYIHTIKGVAANLGIYNLSALAVELEQDLSDSQKFANFTAEMKSVFNSIKENVVLDEPNENKVKDGVSGTKDELITLLKQLKDAAIENNPNTCEEIIKKLQGKIWNYEKLPDLQMISKAIEDYDFDAVAVSVDELLA